MSNIDELGLIRIDDRLIHGQVIAVWSRQKKFTRILILDDQVAADPFMLDVLGLAAPPNIKVEAMSIVDGAKDLNGGRSDLATTMVLMKSPEAALRLHEAGLPYTALNIGGIGSKPGRKKLFRNIAASKDEIAILKKLLEKGVTITLLTVPGEKSKDFADLAGKL